MRSALSGFCRPQRRGSRTALSLELLAGWVEEPLLLLLGVEHGPWHGSLLLGSKLPLLEH